MDYASLYLEKEDDRVNAQGAIIPPNSDKNLDRPKSQKYRLMCDIYEELGSSTDEFSDTITLNTLSREIKGKGVEPRVLKGKRKKPVFEESCRKKSERKELRNSANEDSKTSDFSTESDFDPDEFTSARLNRSKRAVQHTSKSSRAFKGQNKTSPEVVPTSVGAKSAKPVSEEFCGQSSVRSSKRLLRKTSAAPAPFSQADEENTYGTYEYFSENSETASGAVQKRTRETSPIHDNESIVVEALLGLSNEEVHTNALSKTTEEQALSKTNATGSCELEGHVSPAVGFGLPLDEQIECGISVCAKTTEEHALSKTNAKGSCELEGHVSPAVGFGLPLDEQIECGISVCAVNRNPSELEIEEAQKYMWRG